jgi:hypothetical protein
MNSPAQNIAPPLATGVEAGASPGGPTIPEPPRRPEDPQPIVEEPPEIPPEVPNPVGDPPPELPRPFGPGRGNPGIGARGRINRLHLCTDREHRQIQCQNG